MAYTQPRTWVAGQVVTAGQMNEIRDQLLALHALATAPIDASHIVSGTIALARLPEISMIRSIQHGSIILRGARQTGTGLGALSASVRIQAVNLQKSFLIRRGQYGGEHLPIEFADATNVRILRGGATDHDNDATIFFTVIEFT